MFNIRRLDTRIPATWDGDDEFASDPFVDDDTALRASVGDDKINYFNFQRPQGDLFKRDLVNEINLRAVRDYLSTRTGLNYSTPGVRLRAGDWLTIGHIVPEEDVSGEWIVVGHSIKNLTDSATEAFSVSILDEADTEVFAATTDGTVFTAPDMADRGLSLEFGHSYRVRVTNVSAAIRSVAASLIVQPGPATAP